MRAVNRATWTSGEPVSAGPRACSLTMADLSCVDKDIISNSFVFQVNQKMEIGLPTAIVHAAKLEGGRRSVPFAKA